MMEKEEAKQLSISYEEYEQRGRSLSQLIIDKYVIYDEIGKGSYGKVYRGMDDSTKKQVAVKVIDLRQIANMADSKQKRTRIRLTQTEPELMQICDSNYVLKCYNIYKNNDLKVLILQFCNGKTLEQELKEKKHLPENEAIIIIRHIINGLMEMHRHKIVHRDLKTENIMSHNGTYKIIDLGFSKKLEIAQESMEIKATALGTITTMAPEVMNKQPYGLKADIWSLGIIFYQMIYGDSPYDSLNANERYKEISKSTVMAAKEPKTIHGVTPSQAAYDFMRFVIVVESKQRPNWKQVSDHPLIRNIDDEFISQRFLKQCEVNVNSDLNCEEILPEDNSGFQQVEPEVTLEFKGFLENLSGISEPKKEKHSSIQRKKSSKKQQLPLPSQSNHKNKREQQEKQKKQQQQKQKKQRQQKYALERECIERQRAEIQERNRMEREQKQRAILEEERRANQQLRNSLKKRETYNKKSIQSEKEKIKMLEKQKEEKKQKQQESRRKQEIEKLKRMEQEQKQAKKRREQINKIQRQQEKERQDLKKKQMKEQEQQAKKIKVDRTVFKVQTGQKKQPQKSAISIQQISKQEMQKKKNNLDNGQNEQFAWASKTHLECLKTQFIYRQIIMPIEAGNLLNLNDRSSVEFMYLLTARCFNNMSPIQHELQVRKKNKEMINNLNDQITPLYKQVREKFAKLSEDLTTVENKTMSIVADFFSRNMRNSDYATKEKFLSGLEANDYTKAEQIDYTCHYYLEKIQKELARVPRARSVMQKLNMYTRINSISERLLAERGKNFQQYVNQILN